MRLLLATVVSAAAAFGQTFEVASIKPNADPGGEAYVQVVPGRLRMQNVALRTLIQLAWGVEGNPSTQQMQGPMLRALLEDRFKLAVHRETKQVPVYEIRLLNGSNKMQPSTAGSCIPYRPDAPPPTAPEPGQPRPNFCDYPHLGRPGRNRTLDGKGISVAEMALALARAELHRPVIDRTDMPGTFDVHLEWTPDSAEPADGLSIFTALSEQLGLRIDSSRAPSETIVVDRIEKPSPN